MCLIILSIERDWARKNCLGFFWTLATKAACLQELVGCFRPRLSPGAQNRAFTKKCKLYSNLFLSVQLLFSFSVLPSYLSSFSTLLLFLTQVVNCSHCSPFGPFILDNIQILVKALQKQSS